VERDATRPTQEADIRVLHRGYGLHPHKVRDDRYSTSCLEATYASFVLGKFSEVREF
jgi:hypothetical protein